MERYFRSSFSFFWLLSFFLRFALLVRFVLVLLGAGARNPVVRALYEATDPLVSPFRPIIASTVLQNVTIEWPALVAVAAVMLATLALVWLSDVLFTALEREEQPRFLHHHRHA